MNTNPYAPPNNSESASRLAVGFLCLVVCWLAVIVAFWAAYRLSGLTLAVGSIAISWFLFSRSRNPNFYPINCNRMTLIELLTIVGVCAVVYGLTLPPVVISCPHRRSPVPALPSGATGAQADIDAQSSTQIKSASISISDDG